MYKYKCRVLQHCIHTPVIFYLFIMKLCRWNLIKQPCRSLSCCILKGVCDTTHPFEPEGILGIISSIIMIFLRMQVGWRHYFSSSCSGPTFESTLWPFVASHSLLLLSSPILHLYYQNKGLKSPKNILNKK